MTLDAVQKDRKEAELLDWVAQVTGASGLVAERPEPMGRSREIWAVEGHYPDGRPLSAIVRHDTGTGPWVGTAFTLEREAKVLRALQRTNVKTPAFIAESHDGKSILMERLAGTAAFKFDDPKLRESAIEDFSRQLARLHLIEPEDLDLDLPRPKNIEDHAYLDLRNYLDSYERLCSPAPEVEAGLKWLFDNAPKSVQRTSFLQGDCGPGNFMHTDGKLTGIIDWEAAHFGDPMDDLAMIWFRVCFLGSDHTLGDWYHAYIRHSGLDLDIDAIGYYRTALLVRWTISVLVRWENETVEERDPVKREYMLSLIIAALRDPYSRGDVDGALPSVISGKMPPRH